MISVRAALAAIAGSSVLVSAAAPAEAEVQAEPTRLSVPMTVAGFDVERAEAAGNSVSTEGEAQVLRSASGAEISRLPLPKVSMEGSGFATAGTVYGSCGSSYIEIYDQPGDLTFVVVTGFDVDAPPVDFSWAFTVSSSGSGGGFNFDWDDTGPMFPDSNWMSGFIEQTTSEVTRGYDHFAEVTSGAAFLIDGRVCYSGLPSAVTTVW